MHFFQLKFISLVSQQYNLRETEIELVLSNPHMTSIGQITDKKNSSEYRKRLRLAVEQQKIRIQLVHGTHQRNPTS